MTDAAFAIRSVGLEAVPAIRALAHAIWPVSYGAILPAQVLSDMLARIYAPESLAGEMAAGHRFWLAQGETACGFCSAYRQADTLWLKKLYVLPALQGRGLGQALIDAAVAGFAGAREMRLLVNRDNAKAQAYYVRRGFAFAGEAAVDMGGYAVNDFVYAKPLEPEPPIA